MMPEPQIPRAHPILPSGRCLIPGDDFEGDLPGFGIDADPFDRSGGRAHAESDVCPLESGAGGAGGREKPLPVSQVHLPVRSHIDDQRNLLPAVGLLGDQDADVVRADEACLDRQHVDTGRGMDQEAQIARLDVQTAVDRRREGGDAQGLRVDAEEEMVHGGIPDERHVDQVG